MTGTMPLAFMGALTVPINNDVPDRVGQSQSQILPIGDPLFTPPSDAVVQLVKQQHVNFDVPLIRGAGQATVGLGTGASREGMHGDDVMLLLDYETGEGTAIGNPICEARGCGAMPPIAERIEFQLDRPRNAVSVRLNNISPGVVSGDFRLQVDRNGALSATGSTRRFKTFEVVQIRNGKAAVVAFQRQATGTRKGTNTLDTSAGNLQLLAGTQSCGDAISAQPSGIMTIHRSDYQDTKRNRYVYSYVITAELFPPLNAPGWGTQTGNIRVYVNNKPTNSTIGRTKPTSEIVHGRFTADSFEFSGDAPWTGAHRLKAGDTVQLDWNAVLTGADGSRGAVHGSLECRAP